jgi:transposase-like protein
VAIKPGTRVIAWAKQHGICGKLIRAWVEKYKAKSRAAGVLQTTDGTA